MVRPCNGGLDGGGGLLVVSSTMHFAPTTARAWRLSFAPTDTNMVVIRGLQFFTGGDEVFPPFVPGP